MEIVPFGPPHAAAAARLYQQLCELSPCCYPIAPDDLHEALADRHERDERGESLRDGAAFVGLADGAVRGLIHAAVELEAPRGAIRLFCCEPGHRPLAAALLERAEAHCAERGAAAFAAFEPSHRFPFWHLFCGALPDRALHLSSVLQSAGYRRAGGEVFLLWDELRAPPPRRPWPGELRIEVELQPGLGRRPGLMVQALDGDEQIGICLCRSAADCVPGGAAEEMGFIKWLGVNEAWRGRQLGAHLLARAIAELHRLGYPRAIISTSWTNYRAQAFYSHFGARVIDWTFWYHKPLDSAVERP